MCFIVILWEIKMIIRSCLLRNFGDLLNKELVRHISGKEPIIINNSFTNPDKETIYMAIGSVLGWVDNYTEVWGSGFISNTETITNIPKPKKIHAVRGPNTRKELLKRGYDCPKIYGDPALLMKRFYNPQIEKKYNLSIILHYIDKPLKDILKKQFKGVHFIDIQQNIYSFIDEVLASEKIASSALHGLICADTYNIPNVWIKVSDKVLGKGFKFLDHFSSVNRKDQIPLIVTKQTNLNHIMGKFQNYNFPEIDLNPLWASCPFRKDKDD